MHKPEWPKWARTLVVGVDLPEPAMTYRLVEALTPYKDYPATAEEVRKLREKTRPDRR